MSKTEAPKNNIVMVPTDFSEVADNAIDHAIGIAKQLNYKVTLFHVINKDTKSLLKKDNQELKDLNDKLHAKANELKAKHNIEIEYLAKEGSIFTAIGEAANEVGANFLVMGTHGKIGVQHVIGSYAYKVVVSSPVPIIVVQEKSQHKGYHNIVMNIDHTMESKQKIAWAVYLAKTFTSTVHLVYPSESDEFLTKRINNNLNQMRKYLAENGISYTLTKLDGGNNAKSIENYANSIAADLILAITSPDKLTFIMSPWEEQILFNSSKIPVMCVNPSDTYITVLRF